MISEVTPLPETGWKNQRREKIIILPAERNSYKKAFTKATKTKPEEGDELSEGINTKVLWLEVSG